ALYLCVVLSFSICFFFFSSRRRHTRFSRDWSSDVCSSDLQIGTATALFGLGAVVGPTVGPTIGGYITDHFSWPWIFYVNIPVGRSEERRVGKECRSRWSPDPEKEKRVEIYECECI